eukprot:MONOS_11749.2-p1 / transcript=MONOS_11749.2 / gene=MONOS_11749 / organism=Monocercomonoides_exilis_PA203 / gene_product=unspecified product / transcript_product=unspecified product / location=Mono_scaffold00607:36245-37530(+) / protein_length=344 / sequence_SO=supercontig / SO=protein_coding / is_pseudo=false
MRHFDCWSDDFIKTLVTHTTPNSSGLHTKKEYFDQFVYPSVFFRKCHQSWLLFARKMQNYIWPDTTTHGNISFSNFFHRVSLHSPLMEGNTQSASSSSSEQKAIPRDNLCFLCIRPYWNECRTWEVEVRSMHSTDVLIGVCAFSLDEALETHLSSLPTISPLERFNRYKETAPASFQQKLSDPAFSSFNPRVWLASQPHSIALNQSGRLYIGEKSVPVCGGFEEGDVITITLNLLQNIISFSINRVHVLSVNLNFNASQHTKEQISEQFFNPSSFTETDDFSSPQPHHRTKDIAFSTTSSTTSNSSSSSLSSTICAQSNLFWFPAVSLLFDNDSIEFDFDPLPS